jgi:hypothetical protein
MEHLPGYRKYNPIVRLIFKGNGESVSDSTHIIEVSHGRLSLIGRCMGMDFQHQLPLPFPEKYALGAVRITI